MPVPAAICELVQRFEANRAAYRSGAYNETQAPQPKRPTSSAASTPSTARSTAWSTRSMG
jgi:hypothetical protein